MSNGFQGFAGNYVSFRVVKNVTPRIGDEATATVGV